MQLEQIEIYGEILNKRISETVPPGMLWQFTMAAPDGTGKMLLLSNIPQDQQTRFLACAVVNIETLRHAAASAKKANDASPPNTQ